MPPNGETRPGQSAPENLEYTCPRLSSLGATFLVRTTTSEERVLSESATGADIMTNVHSGAFEPAQKQK